MYQATCSFCSRGLDDLVRVYLNKIPPEDRVQRETGCRGHNNKKTVLMINRLI